jgi:uncharacterized protein (DUF433 family)
MSRAITIHLPDAQAAHLARLAERLGSSQDELGARLIDEALRMADFALIEFRTAETGRHAYMQGSTLAVWEVIMLVRERSGDVAATAAYLGWPVARVQAAMSYAAAYPDEIEAALAANAAFDAAAIHRLFPHARIVDVDMSSENAGDDTPSAAG